MCVQTVVAQPASNEIAQGVKAQLNFTMRASETAYEPPPGVAHSDIVTDPM